MALIRSLLLVGLSLCAVRAGDYEFHQIPVDGVESGAQGADGFDNAVGSTFELPRNGSAVVRVPFALEAVDAIPLDGYIKLADIDVDGESWAVHEDIRTHNGNLVFQSRSGAQRVLPRTSEPYNPAAEAQFPRYLGVPIRDVGLALNDVLADRLLASGEPSEAQVRSTIPPITRQAWGGFVGNVQANDVVAVFPQGSTKSFQNGHLNPEASAYVRNRHEGFVGAWKPAIRKLMPVAGFDDYFETIIFGDVDAPDPFVIQTWHRTQRITKGQVVKTTFGYSYPTFAKVQKSADSKKFYKALFSFAGYWERHLADRTQATLPDQSWVDMAYHAFTKELMTRAGGVYPRYGAFDRDYGGSEYDGFQDIFTSALSSNLEWGRFNHSRDIIDNYFTLFVSPEGDINMRGPEVGQYGLSFSLLAKYAKYSGDTSVLEKHKAKILALVQVMINLHEEGLALPQSNPGYGLVHGWSESDACLKGRPDVWWKPYFANSAFTARGFRDLSMLPMFQAQSADWLRRADQLVKRTVESMRASVMKDKGKTLYVPPLPGTTQTFRESMATRGDSEQAWPHRLYAELLHAWVLPTDLQNQVQDTIRDYGATSMGVVANVGVPNGATRDILGFISYGSALSLLYLDRIDEFVLFLFSHRYHVHTRGAWLAGEVTGTAGGTSAFCNPAQATIPIILRWALVLEDQDDDRLYLGRGVPRQWLGTGKEISIKQAPTRWGRVDYQIQQTAPGSVSAKVTFSDKVPKEFEVKLRFPAGSKVGSATVNGRPVQIEKNEAVLIKADGTEKQFTVEARSG